MTFVAEVPTRFSVVDTTCTPLEERTLSSSIKVRPSPSSAEC